MGRCGDVSDCYCHEFCAEYGLCCEDFATGCPNLYVLQTFKIQKFPQSYDLASIVH